MTGQLEALASRLLCTRDIEHMPALIDRAPEIVQLALDADEDLV